MVLDMTRAPGLAVVLSALLVTALAGCGSSENDSDSSITVIRVRADEQPDGAPGLAADVTAEAAAEVGLGPGERVYFSVQAQEVFGARGAVTAVRRTAINGADRLWRDLRRTRPPGGNLVVPGNRGQRHWHRFHRA
jgi:TOBE domain